MPANKCRKNHRNRKRHLAAVMEVADSGGSCQWILIGGDLMKNKMLAKFWETFPQNTDQLQRKKKSKI